MSLIFDQQFANKQLERMSKKAEKDQKTQTDKVKKVRNMKENTQCKVSRKIVIDKFRWLLELYAFS